MPFAAGANLPDQLHIKNMEEQRVAVMGYLREAEQLVKDAEAKLRRAAHEDAAAAQRELDAAKAELEVLKGMEVVSVMWCDPERTDDTSVGGFGCWGGDITDVRLEARRYRKDAEGNKVSGTETRWELCQILQVGSNTKDTRTVLDADHFFMITADDDGSNKARKSLKDITTNFKRFNPSENLERPQMRVDRVAVAHRMAFVPVPKDTNTWAVEVRYVCFGYNTTSASAPKNILLFGDTMNTSVFCEEPGRQVGFQPLYTKLRTSINLAGEDENETKMRCFATAVEATDRSIKNIGTETAEESAAAAAAGKGTQVRTGPATLKGTSSCAWHVAIPIQPPPPAPPPPTAHGTRIDDRLRSLAAGGMIYRSLGEEAPSQVEDEDMDENDDDAAPVYRSAAALTDDGVAAEDRVDSGAPAKRASAKEARIGIGTHVEDAKPFAVKNPVAKPTPAIATAIYIMTVPMATIPDKETILDSCTMLKQRHKQSNEIGDEVEDRLSQQAVDAGLSLKGPLSKKAKTEIETSLGQKILAPGTVEGPPVIAQGRPCLAGVPVD